MPMSKLPTPALVPTAAGVLPFLWGALTTMRPDIAGLGAGALGSRFVGPYVSLFYGAVILSFMSGVLWGFATRATGRLATVSYSLSVLPALWAFLTTGGGTQNAAMSLMAGFVGVLILDWRYWRWGLAPEWWMHLRVPVTAVVLLCLAPLLR